MSRKLVEMSIRLCSCGRTAVLMATGVRYQEVDGCIVRHKWSRCTRFVPERRRTRPKRKA